MPTPEEMAAQTRARIKLSVASAAAIQAGIRDVDDAAILLAKLLAFDEDDNVFVTKENGTPRFNKRGEDMTPLELATEFLEQRPHWRAPEGEQAIDTAAGDPSKLSPTEKIACGLSEIDRRTAKRKAQEQARGELADAFRKAGMERWGQ